MTARGKDTVVKIAGLRGPSLKFVPSNDGTITLTVTAFRVKANGRYEHVELEFDPLTVDQVSFIGVRARQAISYAWGAFVNRSHAARQRVVTIGKDNA
jgi:hypothetical protein